MALIENIFYSGRYVNNILNSHSLKELFYCLRELPLIGTFMAYQIAIDLNYSEVFNFDEDDFTIAGPGAKRGIEKCFIDIGKKDSEYVIKFMVDNQGNEFSRLNLKFKNLFGRDLHAIDCQGLFCETDKYCREKFPKLQSNRKRIKAQYKENKNKLELFFPPKWKLDY